jgi:hypothetical protein
MISLLRNGLASESMGGHDSEVIDGVRFDRDDARIVGVVAA